MGKIRDMLAGITPDRLGDVTEVMDAADSIENELATAKAAILEKETKINELTAQNSKLYARIILTDTAAPEASTPEKTEEEQVDEFFTNFEI